jgi:carbohydrate-selective porin OprB
VRYRDGRTPNNLVGASSNFNPSRYQSGQQWRLMPVFFTYVTPELFGAKDFLTISGGWQNAYTVFADQPDSKLFTNNAIGTTKGIGGVNGFPWSSSYAAWGGYMKVKPVDWHYAMAGLYMAIPEASLRGNHGLDFRGYGPEPDRNGLYFLAETGFTPKIGPDKLPGKYAFGSIYWGLENKSFNGQAYDQKYTFYWQADQMLFREASASAPAPLAKGPSDGKGFKEVKEPTAPEALSEQGLYAFSFVNYAPSYNNAMPFYFHTGLVYKGLIPGRDKDQLGVAFGLGNYSYDKITAEEDAGKTVRQTNEAVVEADYRVQVTKFVCVQPFWQYIIRPDGTGMVHNANILGLHMEVIF